MTKTTARSAANSRRLPLRTLIMGAVAGVLVTTAPILPAAAVPSAPLVQPETSNTAVDVPADDAPATTDQPLPDALINDDATPAAPVVQGPDEVPVAPGAEIPELLDEGDQLEIADAAPIARQQAGSGSDIARQFWVNTPGELHRIDITDDFPAAAGPGTGQTKYSVGKTIDVDVTYGDIALTPDGKTLYGIEFTTGGNLFWLDEYDAITGDRTRRAQVDLSAIRREIKSVYGPEVNSLSVDYDGQLLVASAKSPKIWKIDPEKCYSTGCSINNGVIEQNFIFPVRPDRPLLKTRYTAAGDFFTGADGSLYGIATRNAGSGEGQSDLIRWPAKVPGDPSKGRSDEAVIVGRLKFRGRLGVASPDGAWGGGRIEDQILFAREGSANDLLRHGVLLEGTPETGFEDKLGEAERIAADQIDGIKKVSSGGFYGATAAGDGGPVFGVEKTMILEKEVVGARLNAKDNFLLYSHRAGSRESLAIPVLAADADALAKNTRVNELTGLQPNRHYSYVTVGKEWTVVEELFNASNEKTPIEDYKTQLSCVAGNTWKPYVQGIPPQEIVVPADDTTLEDIPEDQRVEGGPEKRKISTFTVPQFDGDTMTCRFVNYQPVRVEKYPRVDREPAEPVSVDGAGKATLKYTVEVNNASEAKKTVTSGEIFDNITLPEGVTAAGDAKITSRVEGAGNGSIDTAATSWPAADINAKKQVQLAKSVTLDYGKKAIFEIEVPIQVVDGLSDDAWTELGKCSAAENDQGKQTYAGGGVPNEAVVRYDEDGFANNTACIPLTRPQISVEKFPRPDREPAEPVVVSPDGKATLQYTVEAKNGTNQQLTSGAITDKIHLPAGVSAAGNATITSETVGEGGGSINNPTATWAQNTIVDGAELSLADSAELGAGQTARFVITIPIQVAADLSDDQWATLGKCEATDGAAPYVTGGVPNEVAMPGDSDGAKNNTACVPLVREDTPPGTISIEKYPRADREPAQPVKVGADGKATLKYTVEAKNDSAQKATSAEIKDRIRLPQGVTADGDATITAEGNGTVNGPTLSWIQSQIVAGAELPLAQSVTLEPGQKATFTITIPVKVDANLTDEQWTALGTCEAGDANAPGSPGGVPNDVIMANDEDGPGNNTACVPLEPELTGEISVQKFPRPDRDPAPAVKVGPDGKATLTYTVEATNASNQQLTSAAITDKLRLPEGVTPSGEATITSGIVDDGPGTIDSAAQRWTLEQMTGTDALPLAASVTLDPGQTARFTISIPIQVQVNPALSDEQWNELGTCEWTTGEKPTYTTGGVPNDVAMDNDEDGPENNTACITLVREEEPPVGLQLYKLGMNDDGGYTQLADSTFQVFAAGAQLGELGPVVGDAVVNPDGVASISNLALGANYYLVETKAPVGYELLAQPVCFTLKRDGAQAVAAACDGTTLDASIMFNNPTADGQYLNADTAVISVADVRAGLLPASGTAGLLMRLALGGLVAAAGCAMVLRREGVSTGKW